MKKIGFVDFYISEWHANNYPTWIKEAGEKLGVEYQVSYAWAEREISPLDGVSTDEWCEKMGVEHCQSLSELCEKSDVIVILAPTNPEKHLEYAKAVLPYGKRTYIDKTFAPNLEIAKEIFAIGEKHGTPFFSSSALRYSDELAELKDAKNIVLNGGGSNLEEYLGIRKFLPDALAAQNEVGLVTGLAWTSVGGDTLDVEVNVMDGSGKLELTGNLGDVMKESAHAAYSYIRANAAKLGVATDFYKTKDIHVHFPEGAVPKDGPSAGITVCTAMVSALTGKAVRRNVAMTGEISLRGRVMAIGGLKEKTMAALRRGIHTVVIPAENLRDLEEIDQTVRKALNFVVASHIDTVLETALIEVPQMDSAVIGEIPQEIKNRGKKPSIRQ